MKSKYNFRKAKEATASEVDPVFEKEKQVGAFVHHQVVRFSDTPHLSAEQRRLRQGLRKIEERAGASRRHSAIQWNRRDQTFEARMDTSEYDDLDDDHLQEVSKPRT